VEAQLEPGISKDELDRRLHKVIRKIRYWQTSNRRAAAKHRESRCNVLREQGIDLSKLSKCFDLL